MNTERFHELTIEKYQAALLAGEHTTTDLVMWYLDRINRHNTAGKELRAVVTVSPFALKEAARLDDDLARTGALTGPLHGVPILVKDQAETAGIRTTFGSEIFSEYIPETDATVITKLRDAGAVILAKTSMCDFAAGWFSSSSVTGRTKNPYDLDRDSGGSSAGSAAGLSADFGLVAIGEDTGGSIRIPSSFTNLFGLRVTTGLISRFGFSPLVHFQDTPGPMARTIDDLARLLDAIVGYDPKDPFTVATLSAPAAGHYTEAIATAPVIGSWSVGVLETGFGSQGNVDAAPVSKVVMAAVDTLADHGVKVSRDLTIDNLGQWIADTSLYIKQSKIDISAFLAAREKSPASSFMEIYASGKFNPLNDLFNNIAAGPENLEGDAEYMRLRLNREDFQRLVLTLFAENGVDFLVYPTVQVVPPTQTELEDGKYTALTFPTNTVLGSQTGFPALTIPVGFTAGGLPVGMELLGKPFAEAEMLQFASAWEKIASHRQAPVLD